MAVTKTHPIKSTLKAAIDYICNPDKTDGKLLVSSFGCAAETADIEFEWTRRHAIDKGTHLGRHLIQAFEPGEVSPEEAHRIGMELAREVLGGKYEFVLTTHIDKDHVHNHLIFNAVSFTDHKHYHSNKRSYHEIRRASDRLCKEHGLCNAQRKLKKQRGLLDREKISLSDIEQSYGSWRSHAAKGNCYHLIQKTDSLFQNLFKESEKQWPKV